MPSGEKGARRDRDPVDLAILAALAGVPNAYFDLPLLAVRSGVPLPSLLARLPPLERGRYVVRLRDGAAPADRSYSIAPGGLRALVHPPSAAAPPGAARPRSWRRVGAGGPGGG